MRTLLVLSTLFTLLSMPAGATEDDLPQPPRKVSGKELAVQWPQLMTQTISVRVTPVRALSVGRYAVTVDKTRATLLVNPSTPMWTGAKTVCVNVTGPDTIADKGHTTVVGLMLTRCAE